VAFNKELTYAHDQTLLLQSFSATLQQVQGEWQARITTAFTEAVEQSQRSAPSRLRSAPMGWRTC
jgi:hypothetical protein